MTHKIREVTTDDEGHPGFITYGTTTDSNDQGIVTYNLVIGKYQGHIPKVGTFFNFLKSVPGYFICIFTPFFILILVQARNSIKLFRKYKKEQMEEIQAEKKSLEEERVKSQAMMEQLMQMQQAMEKNGGQLPPEYLAQMQAAQSAKPPADAPQPEPQNPAPADVTKAALQPVSHEATMPQQPIQPQHAATQQHAAPVKPKAPTQPVQPQQARPEAPMQSIQYRSQQPAPQRSKPSQSAPQQARPVQRPAQPQPQSSPAPRAHDRAGFDIRTIVGEANDSEDRQK